jgi:hypothetical protein
MSPMSPYRAAKGRVQHRATPVSETKIGDYVFGLGTIVSRQRHKTLGTIRLSFDSGAVIRFPNPTYKVWIVQ